MAGVRFRLGYRQPPITTASLRDLAIAALLLAVGIAMVLPALRPGKVLAPIDLYYETPVYASERPAGYEEPANPHLFDQAYQFTPWRHYAWSRMRAGELPLWNPLSATGTPFVATLQAAVFYPVNLLTLALPFTATFVVSALLRLWIAGFMTYLVLRRYGSSRIAGLLGGTSFMLSGFIISWLGHPHTNVAIWLPALILTVEGLLTCATRSATMRWCSALAAVVGIQFLGGHIETSRDILFAAGLYAVVRLSQLSTIPLRQRLEKVGLGGLAAVGGVGIGAIQLLPFFEWLPLSAEYNNRGSSSFHLLSFDFEPLLALPLAVMPNLYGNPTWEGAYWSVNPWGSFNESVLYAGTIPLSLAIAALVTWRGDQFVRAWAIVGGLTLGMALQLPVFDWINQLPGFALAHPGRLRLIAIFAVAVLAGLGLDAVKSRGRASTAGKLLAISLGVALSLTAGVLIVANVVFARMNDWETWAVSRVLDHFSESPNPPRTVLVCRDRLEACGHELGQAFALSNWEMYLALPVAALALAALWSAGRNRRVVSWITPVLLALSIAELVAIGWGYNPAVSAAPLRHEPPALTVTAEVAGDGRMTVLQQDSLPDSHMLYGVRDVRGLDFKTQWYETYMAASEDRIPWLANGFLLEGAGPLVTNLDVRAVVTSNPYLVERFTNEGSLHVVATVGDLYVLEPVQVTQRATLRFDVQPVASDEEARRLLAAAPERLSVQALVPDTKEARRVAEAIDGGATDWSVTMLRADPERLTIQVNASEAGLLVVSDAYYPGWTATIDGESADILRTNIAFRGVLVEGGSHVIEMRYEPDSIRYGMLLSIISTIVVVAIFGLSYLPRSRSLSQ